MKELVIISGKGGTGKTTLTAALAFLAKDQVLADCDVDAADLHILAHPNVSREEDFRGGAKAHITAERCLKCGLCREACRFEAISEEMVVNPMACEGCGVCVHVCPENAVSMQESLNGRWYISDSRFGPMVHASLFPGEENSGKLVALVRNQAQVLARKLKKSLILVDGAPGVGCPVISSITGADRVLIVTEPTLSGLHDMRRAMQLARGFRIPVAVVINKYDINAEVTRQIEDLSDNANARMLEKIPYDPEVIRAMVRRHCVVENGNSPANAAIRGVWERLKSDLFS
jgi:MinD superfamily P-loop ATPase